MSDDRTAEERGFEVSYFQSIDNFYLNNLFNRKKIIVISLAIEK
jgi:hypothetical protein